MDRRAVARQGIPAALLGLTTTRKIPTLGRVAAGFALFTFWIFLYIRYRRSGREQTRREFELLRRVRWDAYWRHYNERVPTIEEEFEIWGPYHQHRHEMRYSLVATAVRRHLPPGSRVVDVGCGAALVADRLADRDAHYIGFDFGEPHARHAARTRAGSDGPLRVSVGRADASALPLRAGTVDVIVMSEVIEHLIRPEFAVWEIARVLRPGGVLILTTNNASEVPLRSPLSHPLAWLEKALGADVPPLISYRPWVWPERVHPDLLPPDAGDVYLPHTHHIPAETLHLLAEAGLDTLRWSTFEFPPPHSKTGRFLAQRGKSGRVAADVIERVARAIPLVRRLGTHLFVIARKTRTGVPVPPPGVWPGPLSGGDGELRRLGLDRRAATRG